MRIQPARTIHSTCAARSNSTMRCSLSGSSLVLNFPGRHIPTGFPARRPGRGCRRRPNRKRAMRASASSVPAGDGSSARAREVRSLAGTEDAQTERRAHELTFAIVAVVDLPGTSGKDADFRARGLQRGAFAGIKRFDGGSRRPSRRRGADLRDHVGDRGSWKMVTNPRRRARRGFRRGRARRYRAVRAFQRADGIVAIERDEERPRPARARLAGSARGRRAGGRSSRS